jgi:LytR cell envelope-related transcriptional attenuator
MTLSSPSGRPSPLRVGGLALIGVAVVAGIIGLATLATDGDTQPSAAPTDQPPAPTAAPLPTEAPPVGPVPTIDGSAPVPGEPAAPAAPGDAPGAAGPAEPAPAGAPAPVPGPPPAAPAPAPGPGAPAPAAPAPGPPPAAPAPAPGEPGTGGNGGVRPAALSVPLRVYNNSTIQGLAARAAEDFRRAGWPVEEVGNYPGGVIPTSTVYFRPGTDEEAAARALGEQFHLRVEQRFEGIQDASAGIIVIVTNDYGRR